jgi:alpha-L-fucosidase
MANKALSGKAIPSHWRWFNEARYGMFIHWGPYAVYGRGEQALNREHIDHHEYCKMACAWNPAHYDPAVWASVAKQAGMKYAVLTTCQHDGYCLWDTQYTDYSSARQAPRRDFVREYVEAFRSAGLRVGLYYSLIDLRLPGWLEGPRKNPAGWARAKQYVFDQVRELLTNYGKIDVFWPDGLWPRTAAELESHKLIAMVRELQPEILINDRLEWPQFSWFWQSEGHPGVPEEEEIGDFGTPEQGIHAKPGYLWESCQTSTWRLWGHARGARWRSADEILGSLVECASRGGNLLLNVGPQPDGQLPPEYVERVAQIGRWLEVHGEAIYGSEHGNVTEFMTRGWQTVQGNNLYLILCFYDGRPAMRLADLATPVERVTLLTTGQELSFNQNKEELLIEGLPPLPPTDLFPIIKIACKSKPRGGAWARNRIWGEDADTFAAWARRRGTSVWTDGRER